MRRLAAVLLAVAVVALLPGTPARAAAVSRCTSSRGTIVAVSFAHWGGPVVRGCGVQADGRPDASGYALLHDAGFSTAGDSHDGPAFVCRLGDAAFAGGASYPTAAQDACILTPPATAYWSYWLAPPGATAWHAAPLGVMGDVPVTGGVECWTFGATDVALTRGAPPASLIGQLRATAAPVPVRAPLAPVAPPTPKQTAPATPTTRPPAARSTAPTSAATTTASAAVGTTSTPPAAGTTASGPGTPGLVDARATTTPAHRSGSALPVLATLAIVAVLGAGGGVSVLRRRRAEQD